MGEERPAERPEAGRRPRLPTRPGICTPPPHSPSGPPGPNAPHEGPGRSRCGRLGARRARESEAAARPAPLRPYLPKAASGPRAVGSGLLLRGSRWVSPGACAASRVSGAAGGGSSFSGTGGGDSGGEPPPGRKRTPRRRLLSARVQLLRPRRRRLPPETHSSPVASAAPEARGRGRREGRGSDKGAPRREPAWGARADGRTRPRPSRCLSLPL